MSVAAVSLAGRVVGDRSSWPQGAQAQTPEGPRVSRETAAYTGPGNLEYPVVARLSVDRVVETTGRYGDFVRVRLASEGDPMDGFVHDLALDIAPPAMPVLSAEEVPWAPVAPVPWKPTTTVLDVLDDPRIVAGDGSIEVDLRGRAEGFGYYAGPIAAPHAVRLTVDLGASRGDCQLGLFGRAAVGALPPWQGSLRLYVAISAGRLRLEVWDGRQNGPSARIALPELPADAPFSLRFDDPHGRSVTVHDASGRAVRTLDLTAHLPDGLFPDGVLFFGVSVAAGGHLVARGVTLTGPPSGRYVDVDASPSLRRGLHGPTLRELAARRGLRLGTSVNLSDPWRDPRYTARLAEFDILAPIGHTLLGESFLGLAYEHYLPIAERNGQVLRLYNMFWNIDAPPALFEDAPERGQPASPDYRRRIARFMYEGALDTLARFPRVRELGFANEAYFEFQGRLGAVDSPYSRAFGENWIAEAYIETYRAARALGRTPGEDLMLFYGDYNYEVPGPKADLVYDQLARLKRRAAAELGLRDVPLVVDMQLHVDFMLPTQNGRLYAGDVSREKLARNFRRFRELGPLYIGEFSIERGTREQRTQMTLAVLGACLDAGAESLLFWSLFTPVETNFGDPDLLFRTTGDFEPTSTYEALVGALAGCRAEANPQDQAVSCRNSVWGG